MTVITQTYGYLQYPYLDEGTTYLDNLGVGNMGWQATFTVQDQFPVGMAAEAIIQTQFAKGMQAQASITDSTLATGVQAQFVINDEKPVGQQAELVIKQETSIGMQAQAVIKALHEVGYQATFEIIGEEPVGMQALSEPNTQIQIGMQAEGLFLDVPSQAAMQTTLTIADDSDVGQQAEFFINSQDDNGMQADLKIQALHEIAAEFKTDKLAHWQHGRYLTQPYLQDSYLAGFMCAQMGMQAEFKITEPDGNGMQMQMVINTETPQGQQAVFTIIADVPVGMQADRVAFSTTAMQALIAIYNTTNLRILCDFPSRGTEVTGGPVNAWGNVSGIGDNWKASETKVGDYATSNLNTDIVEQIWRTDTDVAGVTLDCDTEIVQGVAIDTFYVGNHNLTTSATVNLIGSNFSNFSVTGVNIPIQVTPDNLYYLPEELPNQSFRYWRLEISDPTNQDGFISMGTILFGPGTVFQGECFVDEFDFELKDFADTVATEGFTNVANSRAQKRVLRLDFRSLSYQKRNFRIMRDIFKTRRTVLKCLWIPTPSHTDMEIVDRFAVFAKLTKVPTERHNNKGPDLDFVTFTLDLDESN